MKFINSAVFLTAMGALLPLTSKALTASFTSSSSKVNEASRDRHYITVQVDEEATERIRIPIQLSGSADPRDDLRLKSDRYVEIKRGDQQGQVEIRMRNDRDFEGNEELQITLLNSKEASIGSRAVHTLTVEDDEGPPPQVNFESSDISVEEAGQELVFKIKLDRASSENITVQVEASGSASDRDDYRIKRDSIRINRGDTEGELVIDIQDDDEEEPSENIHIRIASADGAIIASKNAFNIEIQANDAPLADTVWKQDCLSGNADGLSYDYCITETEGSNNPDVLYYWHGYFGGEKDWTDGSNADLRRQLRMHWQEQGKDAPTVIGISLGMSWMLNENYDADGGRPTLEPIADVAIPQIEQKHFNGKIKGRRLLMGVSMGGFNGLTMLFKRSQLWDKAVIIAPLMPMCDPYMPDEMIYACLSNDPYEKNAYLALQAHKLVQKYFPSPSQWEEASPLNLGRRVLGPDSVPLYLTSGDIDSFGFYTKNKELGELGQKLAAPMMWVPTHGEHGYFDVQPVGDYLSK